MVLSGAFLGLAGRLGTIGCVSRDVAGSIGFDDPRVGCWGTSRPGAPLGLGTFRGLQAGGYAMQARAVPIDMILILQSMSSC